MEDAPTVTGNSPSVLTAERGKRRIGCLFERSLG